ncbi:Major facilitator superfamily domain-containing protein 6, partial [Lamellibrachia satsuma]
MGCSRDVCTPNKRLIPVKGTYFFQLAGVQSLFLFIAIHMKQLGLSASETSIILGTTTFAGAISRTAIGALADKLRGHKAMFISCTLATGIIHSFLMLVPGVTKTEASHLVPLFCGAGGSYTELCTINESSYNDCSEVSASTIEQQRFLVDNTSNQDSVFNISDCSLSCVVSNTQRNNVNVNLEPTDTMSQRRGELLKASVDANAHININVTTFTRVMGTSTLNDQSCHRYSLSSFKMVGESGSMKCDKPTVLLCTTECERPARLHFRRCLYNASSVDAAPFARTFWIYMMIYLFAQIVFSPVFSLIDAITYDYLGDERGKWGRQRLWGTLGNVSFSVTSGYLMDLFSRGKNQIDYTPAFVLSACLWVMCAIMASLYRGSTHVTCTVPSFKDMGALMKRPNAIVLFLLVFVAGGYHGLIENFLFWHLQTLGHPPQLLFGLCMLMNGLPEIVILFAAGGIMKRLGHVNCLCLACAAFAARMLAYSFLRDPWMVLFVEPLHGLTYGLFYATASAYGSLITPPGLHGTMQGIIGALHFGFGRGVGNLEGGQLIELYGTAEMFRIHGISACVLLVLYFLAQQLCINRIGSQTD